VDLVVRGLLREVPPASAATAPARRTRPR